MDVVSELLLWIHDSPAVGTIIGLGMAVVLAGAMVLAWMNRDSN